MSGRPIPATDASHGPFRAVVGTTVLGEDEAGTIELELLECGHRGRRLGSYGRQVGVEPARKRRCLACLPAWEAEDLQRRATTDAGRARRNADDAARVRAELATPGGRAAHDEALRRRRTFTAVDNPREGGTTR